MIYFFNIEISDYLLFLLLVWSGRRVGRTVADLQLRRVLLLLRVMQMLLLLLIGMWLLLHDHLLLVLHQAVLQRVVQSLSDILPEFANVEGLVVVNQLGGGQMTQRTQLIDGAVQIIAAGDAVRRRRQFGHKRRLVAAKGQRAVGDGAGVQFGVVVSGGTSLCVTG